MNFNRSLLKHIHFDVVDSTNAWAKKHSEEWAASGVTLITASGQRAGKGRLNRTWISPPSVNIYATFAFNLFLDLKEIGHIPQVLALTAAEVLESQGFPLKIKWPNDLLLNGKKIGGILCETISKPGGYGVICGIGLNVNMTSETAVQIGRPVTSLLIESGHEHSIEIILHTIQERFLENLNLFLDKGFPPFFPLLKKRLAHKKGDLVLFHHHKKLLQAYFEKIHSDGAVELVMFDGKSNRFYAGEFIQ